MTRTTFRDIAIKSADRNTKIVALVPYSNYFIVATEYQLFTLKNGVLEPMEVVEASND